MNYFQKMWDDYLLTFGIQTMNSFPKSVKSFIRNLKINNIGHSLLTDPLYEEDFSCVLNFCITYKNKDWGFLFPIREDGLLKLNTGEELFKIVSDKLKSMEQKELNHIFYQFYKNYLKKDFEHRFDQLCEEKEKEIDLKRMEDDDYREEYETKTWLDTFLNNEKSIQKEDIHKMNLVFLQSLDSPSRCYLFNFSPKEEFLLKQAQLNTWITDEGAPMMKFYGRIDVYADYTFKRNHLIQLIFIPDYERKKDSFVYWHDHHLWYRASILELENYIDCFYPVGKVTSIKSIQ